MDDEVHFDAFISVLRQLSGVGLPIVVSTRPRTRRWLDERHVQIPPGISFLKPLGFLDYVRLELDARCTLSDSGTITEESNILRVPALNLREAHERPEGMEEAVVITTGLRPRHRGGKLPGRLTDSRSEMVVSARLVTRVTSESRRDAGEWMIGRRSV